MKDFPRIYSISTVGLIFHYNVDYILHPFRTDFNGESGIGKSMIADLLQLIFVAKGKYYKPGTESSGSQGRSIATLPLDAIGYAFVNIQKTERQFLTIGVFIQKSTGTATPFIIQKGIHWERNSEFDYNDKIILHKTFLGTGNKIPDLDTLKKDILKPKQFILESFHTEISLYHHLLYYNELLPIDLGQEESKLITYSQIIQSFARAKTTMLKNKEFKNFLFADDEDIYDEYQKQVLSLETYNRQFQEQRGIINKVESRFEALKVYKKAFIHRNKALSAYLTDQAIYDYQRYENVKKDYHDSKLKNIENAIRINQLHIGIANQEFELAKKEVKNAELAFDKETNLRTENSAAFAKSNEKLNDVNELITALDGSYKSYIPIDKGIKDLESHLSTYKTTEEVEQQICNLPEGKRNLALLSKFIKILTAENLLDEFNRFNTEHMTFEDLLQRRLQEQHELGNEIRQYKKLIQGYSKENQHSIMHWVSHQGKRSFPIAEESILRHYMHLSITEPEVGSEERRYIPSPDNLLSSLRIVSKSKEWLWVDNGGIYERIDMVKEPLLGTAGLLHENVEAFINEAKQALGKKSEQLAVMEKLKQTLAKAGWSAEIKRLLLIKEHVLAFVEDVTLPTLTQFDEMKEWYKKKDYHEFQFKKIEGELRKARDNQKEYEKEIIKYQTTETLHKRTLQELTLKKEEAYQKQKTKDLELSTHKEKMEGIKTRDFQDADDKLIARITSEAEKDIQKYIVQGTIEIGKLFELEITPLHRENVGIETRLKEYMDPQHINGLEFLLDKRRRSGEQYRAKLGTEIEVADTHPLLTSGIVELSSKTSEEAERKLEDARTNRIIPLLPENETLLIATDLEKIARELIPKVFEGKQIDNFGEQLEEEVVRYLTSMNDKMKSIDEHKLRIIESIFTKVSDVYYDFEDKIKDIKSFFEAKQITGSMRVKLDFKPSGTYPIEWINTLKKKMNTKSIEKTPLFRRTEKDESSAEEIIINVFKEYSSSKIQDPDIRKLTNPKSYFEVEVSLVDLAGDKTNGSSGQDYAKIALLCIARLSKIEQDRRTKKRKTIPGIRFMPIDEVAGLGGNFTLLNEIAEEYDYQVLTMTISPDIVYEDGKQYVYHLNSTAESEKVKINLPPFGLFSDNELQKNIDQYIKAKANEEGIDIPGH